MNGTEGHGKNGIALFLVETLQLLTIAAALEEGIVVHLDEVEEARKVLDLVELTGIKKKEKGVTVEGRFR